MAVERVSSIYDLQALQAEQDKYLNLLQQSKQAIIDLNNMRVGAKAGGLSSLVQTTQQLNQAIQASTSWTNNAINSQKALTAAEIENRLAISKRTASIKNDIVETKSALGSYDQLQATLKRLTVGYKAMSQAQRDSDAGKAVRQNILDTKNVLKSLDSGVGDHQRNVGNYTKSIATNFGNAAETIAKYALAYVGFNAIKSFFTGAIDEALEAEKAAIRFRATLDNLGRVDAFDRLMKKANDMAATFTHLDNDEIVGVFEKLVTYGKLTERQIDQLTPIIINFAAKSGISVTEASGVIIKSLEGNARALKEYGISIKDADTVTERFGIVVDELGKKVEGAAEAFGETTTGKIAQTKQSIANLKEEIGIGLLPTINKLLIGVNGLIQGFIRMADDGITGAVGRAFKGLNIYMFQGEKALQNYQTQMKEFGTATEEVKKKTVSFGFGLDGKSPFLVEDAKKSLPDIDKAFGGDVDDEKKKVDKKKVIRKDNLQSIKETVDTEFQINEIAQKRKIAQLNDEINSDKTHYLKKIGLIRESYILQKELLDAQEREAYAAAQRTTAREKKQLEDEKAGKSTAEKSRINENIKILEENLGNQIFLIQAEYLDKGTDLLEKEMKERESILVKHGKKAVEIVDEFAKAEQAARDAVTDAAKKKAEDDDERDKQLDKIREFTDAALDLGQTFGDADLERKQEQLRKENELIDERVKREIEAVEASTRTEEQKAAAIAIIQARALAEQKANDAQQRRLDFEKARFDKAIAILQIVAQIGVSIAKGKFGAAALAGIALVKLIATPIPRYKGGRGEGKDELAYVHQGEYIDRGKELQHVTAVETLTHLMPKDKVYRNKAEMMRELAMSGLQLSDYSVNKQGGIDKTDMKKFTNQIVDAVSEIKINTMMITKEGWRNHNQKLAQYDAWVEKYIKN